MVLVITYCWPSLVGYFEYFIKIHVEAYAIFSFLKIGNEEQQEKLLREWLDCCVTEGGVLVAMQKSSCRRNHPLVTQMVEKWLDRYRQIRPCTSLSDGEEDEDDDDEWENWDPWMCIMSGGHPSMAPGWCSSSLLHNDPIAAGSHCIGFLIGMGRIQRLIWCEHGSFGWTTICKNKILILLPRQRTLFFLVVHLSINVPHVVL